MTNSLLKIVVILFCIFNYAVSQEIGNRSKLLQTAKKLRGELYRLTSESKYLEAIPKAEQLVDVAEQLFGPEHASVLTLLSDLADLYEKAGRSEDAKKLQAKLAQKNKPQQGQHLPEVQRLLILSKSHFDRGDYPLAYKISQEALRILEENDLGTSLQAAVMVGEIGRSIEYMGQYELAEVTYLTSLRLAETKGKQGLSHVATVRNNLGNLYWKMGRLEDAKKELLASIDMQEAYGDSMDPELFHPFQNLGLVHVFLGQPDKGKQYYLKARDVIVNAYGEDHHDLSTIYNNLAALAWRQQDYDTAIKWQEQANHVVAKDLIRNIVLGSERQKRLYMKQFIPAGHASISLSLLAKDRQQAGRLGFNSVLQQKGRVMDALTKSLERIRRSLSASELGLFEEYLEIQRIKSQRVYGTSGNLTVDPGREETLKTALAEQSASYRDLFEIITLEDVQSTLPDNSALIEFVLYRPGVPAKDSADFIIGPPRYAAYLLTSSKKLHWLNFAEESMLQKRISDFQRGLSDPRSTYVKRVGHELYKQLIQPLQPFLVGTKQIFIAPDGALNLIPFNALVDENGSYLAENYTISYISSGRDLLRKPMQIDSVRAAVIVADPYYGKLKNDLTKPCSDEDRTAKSSFKNGFPRLCGTKLEASAIMKMLPDASLLTGASATETAIKQLSHPRILHIATHGFYLADALSSKAILNPEVSMEIESDLILKLDKALLLSGLVFAGANSRSSGNDDGILTALETTGLDLSGTQLVVLSACETGVGEATAGEGVFGLRRAFVLAGAESQIMSLWKVSDIATAKLMSRYYELLLGGLGRSAALRKAELELMSNTEQDMSHPFYWASFILSGDWRPLPTGIRN